MPEDQPKKSFILYTDQYEPIKDLTDSQKGYLLDCIFMYHRETPLIITDPTVKMAFNFFTSTFKRDKTKYDVRCEKNRINALKRWGKK